MDGALIMATLSVWGILGYVLLFFATKEPRHRLGNLFIAIYGLVLLTTIVAGLFLKWHVVFWWQGATSFYAIYGFLAFVFIIYAAKGLRLLLQRDEDYYEKISMKKYEKEGWEK